METRQETYARTITPSFSLKTAIWSRITMHVNKMTKWAWTNNCSAYCYAEYMKKMR